MTFQEWLATYMPLIGSDGEDDGGGDNTDGDKDASQEDGAGKDADNKDGQTDADAGGDDADEDETDVTISAKELENIRQENARLKREDRKRNNEAKDAKEKKQREEGRHEELAKEREEERNEEKAKREAAEFELDQTRRDIRTRDAASSLNFREPEDAIRFLTADDTESVESVTRALKKLAEKKPYLLNDRPRSGRAGNGSGNGSGDGLSVEEIKKMSTQEVAERMPEVKKALARQQPTGGRT